MPLILISNSIHVSSAKLKHLGDNNLTSRHFSVNLPFNPTRLVGNPCHSIFQTVKSVLISQAIIDVGFPANLLSNLLVLYPFL